MRQTFRGTLDICAERDGTTWLFCNHDGITFGLKNGDLLTVYEPDSVTVRWQGTVNLRTDIHTTTNLLTLSRPYPQQVVMGMVVRGLQDNLSADAWAMMFAEGLSATLTREV